MKIDPDQQDVSTIYSVMIRAIVPRPIAWVSTVSPAGITNLAPFSYFNGICSRPPALMFSPVNQPDGSPKDTVRNIEANGQFVVNLVPFELAQPMVISSKDYDYEESEIDATGLATAASEKIAPPRIARSPIQFECELLQLVRVGDGPLAANVIIGRILLMHIDDRVLDAAGKIDPHKADLIGRMGGRDYCFTRDRFTLE